MNPFRTSKKTQEFKGQNPYLTEPTSGVCLQNTYDYSPFGVSLDGRTSESEFYRYGFQKQEKDYEFKGKGNSLNFEYRMYDSRVGRFLSLDKFESSFPNQSPYLISNNSPIINADINGNYSVAMHYIVTYRVMLDLGYSKQIARKVAHYSSVYADHPDWSLFYGAMRNVNDNLMRNNLLDPKELDYKSNIDYSHMKNSQSDYFVSTVSIHAMRTFWEDITPKQAVKRALYGGEFETKDGGLVRIEGAYKVITRLSNNPIDELTESQLKELGVALHTVQDAQVHKGKRWVDKHKEEADQLGNSNEHPNMECLHSNNIESAIQKTAIQLRKFDKKNKEKEKK